MPIVAMVAIDLLDMAVLRLTLAPSQHYSPVGQEHGRTIPLAAVIGPPSVVFSGASVAIACQAKVQGAGFLLLFNGHMTQSP